MSLLSRLLGKSQKPIEADEVLVPVPIPPLVALLDALEKQKGDPLTEAEVLEARDKAPCIMMTVSDARAIAESRGFADINPENVWAEWLEFRSEQSSLN